MTIFKGGIKMDFYDILTEIEEGHAYNPYAGKTNGGQWIEGTISIEYLNDNYGQYNNVDELIQSAKFESHKLYFIYLKSEGILP